MTIDNSTQSNPTPKLKVFTSKKCPDCNLLKQILKNKNIDFEEIDGTTIKSIAYLRARKVSLTQLPIIERDNKFYLYEQYFKEFL